MPPPLPKPTDFPSTLSPIIHLPANAQPTNAIIFLPGLGDNATNFSSFARALNLPDALTITLNPPFPLPLPLGLPGTQWSEDLHVDTSTGDLDLDVSPLAVAVRLVADDVIAKTLIDRFKYRPDQIHLFGFGQGGSVAVAVPLHPSLTTVSSSLGGVISIGGGIPLSLSTAGEASRGEGKVRTPLLLLSGSKSPLAAVGSSPLKRVNDAYEFVDYHRWKKADDSMPKNRDEVMPMMQFWARRLRSRRGVPDDAVELTG
jgi:predicted esterase